MGIIVDDKYVKVINPTAPPPIKTQCDKEGLKRTLAGMDPYFAPTHTAFKEAAMRKHEQQMRQHTEELQKIIYQAPDCSDPKYMSYTDGWSKCQEEREMYFAKHKLQDPKKAFMESFASTTIPTKTYNENESVLDILEAAKPKSDVTTMSDATSSYQDLLNASKPNNNDTIQLVTYTSTSTLYEGLTFTKPSTNESYQNKAAHHCDRLKSNATSYTICVNEIIAIEQSMKPKDKNDQAKKIEYCKKIQQVMIALAQPFHYFNCLAE